MFCKCFLCSGDIDSDMNTVEFLTNKQSATNCYMFPEIYDEDIVLMYFDLTPSTTQNPSSEKFAFRQNRLQLNKGLSSNIFGDFLEC